MSTPSRRNIDDFSDLGDDLENWMTNLPQKLKSIPIIYLVIPGSHDSFTANMTTSSDISPDAEDIVKALAHLGPIVKQVILNWSKTQTYMAADQLTRGIRYFDLRIATKTNSEDLYIVHGLYSDSVQSIFDEISSFLNKHPQEIVILDCQHFYSLKQSDHEKMLKMLNTSFGAKLLPHSNSMNSITLDYMTSQNKYQVIVIYREDTVVSTQSTLWPSASFPNPWPNTVSTTDLFNYLDRGLKNRNSNIAYISQCLLTPSVDFILENVLSSLKEKCAVQLEKQRLEWINKQKPGNGGMNIIIADFIELSDNEYVKAVIKLNTQLSDVLD